MPKDLRPKKKEPVPTIREQKYRMEDLHKVINKMPEAQKLELFERVKIGRNYHTCHLCGKVKNQKDFYTTGNPMSKTSVTPICKACAYELAMPMNEKTGQPANPTAESVQMALEYMDRPFLNVLWEASLLEAANPESKGTKNNVWTAYAKNIGMKQFLPQRWRESDIFNTATPMIIAKDAATVKNKSLLEEYEKNKNDTIRLLGYDPFETEHENDKPFLYSQFIGYCDLDEDAGSDMMRISSIIEIVKGFLHNEKINDMISVMINDTKNMSKNIATIRALEDTKSKITSSIQKLAVESCISLKNNKSVKKGDDTFTGRTRKLKDMNLREAEVNGFDIGTCRGMRQVADISNQSILNKIRLDENDYSEMIVEQRLLIQKYMQDAEKFEEQARLLLRENVDLKEYLKEKGLYDESMFTSETILYDDRDGFDEYEPMDYAMSANDENNISSHITYDIKFDENGDLISMGNGDQADDGPSDEEEYEDFDAEDFEIVILEDDFEEDITETDEDGGDENE